MMKIAILTPTFSYHSGIDRVAQQQAEEYVRKGNKVTIFTLQSSIRPKGYKVMEMGMPASSLLQRLYRLFFFLDRKKMMRYKDLKNFDMIISHFYPMNWLAYRAKKAYGIQYVYFDHGINTTGLLDSFLQKIYMKLFLFFNNMTLKNIDEAFSVSKYLQEVLLEESGIKSKVQYNKIDTKRFNKKISGAAVIKKYKLEKKPVFLYVGRIAPHKGIHLLIEAFSYVKKKLPNAVLLIAGKPTFPGYFEKLQETNTKDVIFAGFVDDKELPSYFAACNVYVSASQWEGFNLPAAEAQACGKPVVAFNLGSHPEIVKKGILVKNKDMQAFADAMSTLYTNESDKKISKSG